MRASAQFVGRRQEEKVRRTHAIDGRHKCHGNSPAHLVDILQMLHHLNQSQDGADNAHRGSISTGCFVHLGLGFRPVLLHGHLEFHHLADSVQIGAVHRQVQRLAQKFVRDAICVLFERHDAVLARLGGKADDFINGLLRLLAPFNEHRAEVPDGPYEHRKRSSDQRRRDLGNIPDFPAFQQ
jgi:hypothetical protein